MITKAFDLGFAAGHAAQQARNQSLPVPVVSNPYKRTAQLIAWSHGFQHGADTIRDPQSSGWNLRGAA